MSTKKLNFKLLNNCDKVKLINNSLVLEGLSLKELSKKINVQKKEIMTFMKSEGFSFDEIEGYFKKESPVTNNIEKEKSLSVQEDAAAPPPSELEDVQSIIDSINKKLNLKEIETQASLLPEIKPQNKSNSLDTNIVKSEKKTNIKEEKEILTLEIPKVSRTERRKILKKSPFKRFMLFLKSLFSNNKKNTIKLESQNNISLPVAELNTSLADKPVDSLDFKGNTYSEAILKEVATDVLKDDIAKINVKDEIDCYESNESIKSKLSFEIKLPLDLKVLSKKYDKNIIKEKNIIDLDKVPIDYLKEEISKIRIDSSFIETLKSNNAEDSSSEDLEIRISNLEKKVSELEEFFVEIFQGMLIK